MTISLSIKKIKYYLKPSLGFHLGFHQSKSSRFLFYPISYAKIIRIVQGFRLKQNTIGILSTGYVIKDINKYKDDRIVMYMFS